MKSVVSNALRGFFVSVVTCFLSQTALAAIAFDNASSKFDNNNNSTITWSHTIGSGSNRMLVVGLGAEDTVLADLVISSVKYNGTNMTLVAGSSSIYDQGSTKRKTELYYMLDANLPSAGTYTVMVTYTGSVSSKNAGAISLTGAAQRAREAVAINSNQDLDAISTNITTLTNGAWVVDAIVSAISGSFTATGSGMTERWDIAASASSAAGSTRPVATAGQVTISWLHSAGTSGNRIAHSVAAFAKAEDTYPLGDLSHDWMVGWADLGLLADQWLAPSGCPGPNCADFDGSGNVNFKDYAILIANWTIGPLPDKPVINEVMASNSNTIADEQGQFDDWIEIFNPKPNAIDIGGMYITDDLSEPTKWRIPTGYPGQTTIPSHGHLLLWADDDEQDGPLHLPFQLSASGEAVGLFAADGNLMDSLEFPAQVHDVSYGPYPDASENIRYMGNPTPGTQNSGGYLGWVETPDVSRDRGFYEAPFDVILSCQTGGASIRYTLNGSEPTETSTLYTAPIPVAATKCLRVKAFKSGWLASKTKTCTYILYASDAVKAMPVISLVGDVNESLFRPNGVMAHPTVLDYEKPVSVELINPQDNSGFQQDAGLQVHGSDSTRPEYILGDDPLGADANDWQLDWEHKFSFKLFFRDIYGKNGLDYPLFPDSEIDRFDAVVLRANKNDWKNPFLKDEWIRRLHKDMGYVASTGDFVNLFINGVYKGYYNPCERLHQQYFQEIYKSNYEWDVISQDGVRDGDSVAWDSLISYANGHNLSFDANYQEVGNRLDITAFIDYCILQLYSGNYDWVFNNWVCARERSNLENGKFKYYLWDTDAIADSWALTTAWNKSSFDDLPNWFNPTGLNGLSGSPMYVRMSQLYLRLKANSNFRMLFGDRIHKFFHNGGALSKQHLEDRFWELGENLSFVIPEVMPDVTEFNTEMPDSFIPVREDRMMEHFVAQGLYPTFAPPAFSQHGGEIAAGGSVTITGTGTIKYTTNGSEPKDYGTIIASGGTVTINNSLVLKARASIDANWSALNEATFAVGPIVDKLRITEIMYHPIEPNDVNTEFIELKNIGTSALNLNLVKLTEGIHFTFPNTSLAAGDYVLVVQDQTAFTAHYGGGKNVAGTYTGALANNGERIRLEDAIGRTILDFQYSDNWVPVTDGGGFSLNFFDADANSEPNRWAVDENWCASKYPGGSPNVGDAGLLKERSVAINEILAHQDAAPEDWIELKNTTASSINIGGWYLSDSEDDLLKYRIRTGTTLASGAYIVFTEDANFGSASSDPCKITGFALSENGETVYLTSADGNILTGYREQEDFGASENGVAFGRYYKGSTNTYNFVAMSSNTPGAANAYPKVGPIVINEIMYNPPTGNQSEEYIELKNITGSGVTLYDSVEALPWKFTDGIDFTFQSSPAVTIPANGYIVVAKDKTAFSAQYPSVPSDKLFGPYGGHLDNGGETVELSKPGDVEFGTRYYIRVDRVVYSDGTHPVGTDPWPTTPDGGGKSLSRTDPNAYGNDPNNWHDANPSPAVVNP